VKGVGLLRRRRAARWLVPVGVLGAAALAATGALQSGSSSRTPPAETSARLMAQAQVPLSSSFSGTIVSQVAPDLPQLPLLADGTLDALLAGSHTLQIWYADPARQRVALLDATGETDVFRDGARAWQWDSHSRSAVVLTSGGDAEPATGSGISGLSPAVLVDRLFTEVEADSNVQVKVGLRTAQRPSYELVLTPRTVTTRIGEVDVEIDQKTKLPLGIQLYARGTSAPALDVQYSTIRFGKAVGPDFTFTPPAGSAVTAKPARTSPPRVQVIGTGWTQILEVTPGSPGAAQRRVALTSDLTPVTGSWGAGRLLDSPTLCMLVTTTGETFAGAVDPDALYAAAAGH
jgi:outer membrane lipoprotein-sorting protein